MGHGQQRLLGREAEGSPPGRPPPYAQYTLHPVARAVGREQDQVLDV